MNTHRDGRLVTFVACAVVAALARAAPPAIEVFTHHPDRVARVPGYTVTVIDMGAPARIAAPAFDADPARARRQARVWLQSPAGRRHIAALQQAHRGPAQAIAYGLKKLPAIVFDRGRYVVYGTTDVRRALRDYHRARGSR